jgi:hypothetical protein
MVEDYQKPSWWKKSIRSYWIVFVLIPFAAVLATYSALVYLGIAEVNQLLTYLIVTIIAIAIAYYVRTIPSSKLWRKIWIVMGVGAIGFPLAIALGLLFNAILTPVTSGILPYVLAYVAAIVLGGLLGDQIGKRRDYRPFG